MSTNIESKSLGSDQSIVSDPRRKESVLKQNQNESDRWKFLETKTFKAIALSAALFFICIALTYLTSFVAFNFNASELWWVWPTLAFAGAFAIVSGIWAICVLVNHYG